MAIVSERLFPENHMIACEILLSESCPESHFVRHLLNEGCVSNCEMFTPLRITMPHVFVCQGFFNPCSLLLGQLIAILAAQKFCRTIHSDDSIPSRWRLELAISAMLPFAGMTHLASATHVQINIGHASPQVLPGFDGNGMIAILPKCAPPTFSLVILLPRSAGNQLHASGNAIRLVGIRNKKVNMV